MMGRARVYETPAGVEFDLFRRGEILRRRLFFDEIVLVTYHRSRGVLALVVLGLLALGGVALAVAVGRQVLEGGLIVLGTAALPFLVLFLVQLTLGVHTVTVFGRRTMARAVFSWRPGRARGLYERLRSRVAEAQAEAPTGARSLW